MFFKKKHFKFQDVRTIICCWLQMLQNGMTNSAKTLEAL